MNSENTPPTHPDQIKIGFINPALLPGWFWLPTAYQIHDQGFDYAIPDLPRDNPAATAEDNVDIIEEALQDSDQQYIVALSRGVEFAVRYIDRLAKKDSLHKVIGWTVISSAGPRGYEITSEYSSQPLPRHTPEYSKGISLDEKGLEEIDLEIAQTVLLQGMHDSQLRSETLAGLIHNRPLSADEIASVPHLEKKLLPLSWYVGLNDTVDNTELSSEVARQKFGIEPTFTDWAHLGPLTHTHEVSKAIITDVLRAEAVRRGVNK